MAIYNEKMSRCSYDRTVDACAWQNSTSMLYTKRTNHRMCRLQGNARARVLICARYFGDWNAQEYGSYGDDHKSVKCKVEGVAPFNKSRSLSKTFSILLYFEHVAKATEAAKLNTWHANGGRVLGVVFQECSKPGGTSTQYCHEDDRRHRWT